MFFIVSQKQDLERAISVVLSLREEAQRPAVLVYSISWIYHHGYNVIYHDISMVRGAYEEHKPYCIIYIYIYIMMLTNC